MTFAEDGVREVQGVRCRSKYSSGEARVSLVELDRQIFLDATDKEILLTPWQARYLAAKLYRLARRINARNEGIDA